MMFPVAVLFCLTAGASAQNLFGKTFEGDATFYGDQGDQSSGNCAFGVTGAAELPWTSGLTGPRFLALS